MDGKTNRFLRARLVIDGTGRGGRRLSREKIYLICLPVLSSERKIGTPAITSQDRNADDDGGAKSS
jgi:hypothetical protein